MDLQIVLTYGYLYSRKCAMGTRALSGVKGLCEALTYPPRFSAEVVCG